MGPYDYGESATDFRDFGCGHFHNYLQLYLRALMELEGVLGLVVMQLVRSMRMFVGLYNTLQRIFVGLYDTSQKSQ